MNSVRLTPPPASRDLIAAAIETHGAVRVLLSALRALLRPKARPPDVADLPDHLRRDVGLPPLAYEPHWSRYLN